MSSTRLKDESHPNVTNHISDDSSDSGSEPESDRKMDDTSSVKDQKVTTVVAVMDTSPEDPENGIEHSKKSRRSNKLLFTKQIRVLLNSGVP